MTIYENIQRCQKKKIKSQSNMVSSFLLSKCLPLTVLRRNCQTAKKQKIARVSSRGKLLWVVLSGQIGPKWSKPEQV